ncbi:MAG: tRNA preQ1(34) S-adenosylmethionine ribosyltransferase-isomerase QueA [Rhodospirillaceae bacterium]|nr:tRNA preQ1(34) S-adenosylmethionine ribosyltransferase-isomerase QueA [Rhodospirillaceae bacterium]
MRVDLFDFDLPPDRIADRPVSPREQAKLLHVAQSGLADHTVGALPALLKRGDIMVFNDTRVIPARLLGQRGVVPVEILLHKQQTSEIWQAFARPAKRLKPGQRVEFSDGLSAEVLERDGPLVTLRFNNGGGALMAKFEAVGHVPLPPYIQRADDARDRSDYQTVYAARDGAVAAPTAGLHFTPALLAALDAAGIARVHVTLHVGAGTFLPVSADDTADHKMHAEWGEISADTAAAINAARAAGGRVVAVGTTALRLMESAAAPDGTVQPFTGDTAIFITPGVAIKTADLLMTNFHLPRSTLYMLVSAFAGMETMRAAYAHAIANGYRFYSYGDASLLERAI